MNAYRGIIYNNMGMTFAQKFILLSRESVSPESLTQDRIN